MSADDQRALMRDIIRSFLSRSGGRERFRALRHTRPGYDRKHWSELADVGCIGALVPAELGGVGLELGDMAGMLEEFGSGIEPEPVVPVAVAAVRLLSAVPESDLARRLLPALSAGQLIPCVAWQGESDAMPNLHLPACTASGVVSGRCRFVAPADGDGLLVLALRGFERVLCWLPGIPAGASIAADARVDGAFFGDVVLDSVGVARENIAAGPGLNEEAVEAIVAECNVCISAQLLGISRAALEMTLDYLRVREQFGKPIGSFQALQHRAVDMHVKLELARAALGAAVSAPRTSLPVQASRAKARCAETALAICREAVQMHGAMGFADECDVGLLLKRALVLSAWLGNASWHRAHVQRSTAKESAAAWGPESIPTHEPRDWEAMPDEEFRLRVRYVFETEYPRELRNPPRRLRWHECREFYRKLGALGLLALAWPKEHGGAGLGPRKQIIFMEEQDRLGVARAPDMGITMVGPGLIQYGTPEQQRRFLPPILSFDHMWCQGFSEPNAGSDLASLRMRAVREGDEYVLDGAKIWTTFAHDATHMFALARTDRTAKKQAGISVFLVDMKARGITVRTIADIAGHEEFCEVHFSGVRVPADGLLGRENDGWSVAKMLLANERIYLGNPRQAQYALARLDEIVRRLGLGHDAAFADRLTRLRLDVWDLASLFERFAEQVRRGEPLGPDVSILKLFGSETYQRLGELAIEAIGCEAALAGAVAVGSTPDDVMSLFMNSRPSTIYGGSSEVQRNVLAKQVLGLPS